MRRMVLAVLISTIGLSASAADDPLTGSLTETQVNAIKMTTIAMFAGSKNTCPRFHVVERSLFEELADGAYPLRCWTRRSSRTRKRSRC